MAFGRKKRQQPQVTPVRDTHRDSRGHSHHDDGSYGQARPYDPYGGDYDRQVGDGDDYQGNDSEGYDGDSSDGYDEYGPDDGYRHGDHAERRDSRSHHGDGHPSDGHDDRRADEYDAEDDDVHDEVSGEHGESEDDWARRWSSWVPDEAFEDEDDNDDDLEESEFGEEYVDEVPRKRQNLPYEDRTREMAQTFVDRFRNGGTVGSRTKTNRIVKMQAVSESDIPTIKRRLRRSNMPYNILLLVFAGLVIVPSVMLYNYFHSLAQNDIQMNAITAQYTRPIAQTPAGMETVQVNETDMPPIVDFDGLQSLNSEVSSWLRVPGTTIDYPVMTTTTEAKYLRLDIEGNYSVPGCLFTDWDNSPDLANEQHIVIYGHHLPWPAMFHDMSLYLEEPGFVNEHRKMYYETPDQTYELKVIGIHKARPEEWQARKTIFNDQEEFQVYVDERIAANDVYDSGDYDRKTINKFFTFITCTDSGSARCIVNAIVTAQYPTGYVPLVRAKMQGLIKADGTIDADKEARQKAEKERQEQEAQQQAEQQAQQEQQAEQQ